MAVQDALINAAGNAQTWFNIGNGNAGLRVIVVLVDRAGGETASVAMNVGTWSFNQIVSRVTNPADTGTRRSVFMLEAIVPSDFAGNAIISSEVLNGSSIAVAHSRIAILANEAAEYELAAVASADSAGATTLTQSSGVTSQVPAGDLLVVAGETTRGAGTAEWDVTTNTPDRPGSENLWDLTVAAGTGASQRRGSLGYAYLAESPEQTWEDIVTYSASLMSSAVIAVWRTPTKPLANAGSNQTVTAGTTVQLDGQASSGDGGPYTFKWRQVSGTQTVTFSPNDEAASVTFTTQAGLTDVVILGLVVTDSSDIESQEALVAVTVHGPKEEIYFRVDPDGKLDVSAPNIPSWKSSDTIPAGQWTHVAFTRSGSSVALYINGEDAGVSQSGDVADINFGEVEHYVGSWGNGVDPFDGQIDDVRLFDTALDQAQVQLWMNTPIGDPVTRYWRRGDGVILKPYLKTPGGLVELE